GGEDDAVALAALAEPLAEDGLRLAAGVARHPARVHVSGVDEVHAGVDPGVEQAERHRLVDRPAKDVAAEADARYLESRAAERASVHRTIVAGLRSPCWRAGPCTRV